MIPVKSSRATNRSLRRAIGLRSISILSKFKLNSSQDISKELSNDNLPKVTGNGPFIELPSFKPLGNPSDLLNITLPQSSKLSIRNGTIIGINGDLKKLSSVPQILHKTEYQELTSNSSVSLLINGGMNNYSIIEVNSIEDKWTILNDKSIIAWTGFNLQLKPIELLERCNSFQTDGKGIIIVNGEEQLFDITLSPNEQILINPNSLVASNSSISYSTLNRPWTEPLKFSRNFQLPTIFNSYINSFKSFISSRYSRIIISLGIINQMKILRSYYHSFKKLIIYNVINKFYNKPIYFKITGPGRLLLDNNVHLTNRKNFTKKEINDILRN
ncbi:DEHA2G17622p [Debaryomyces hansenii CBS767]|uniref:Altered inheritance of mitochondria protein 24, mitochondrial n=1 Tax=Debaryomyces hansenii (strain ATCC 36239 / CBS 767 / BCRC 21394 / JCM 1990 / NBRC 0083 / IGC 2968) TaxID=284592 RepID=Q6BHL7_DEBHA|nr:DEHA2G17622p [Debaryomyces hansenii CBS767]CAG90810.1 DEHA2G17622p [Debaryomyces hansenii CBS767]|eukprot:XP_462304.1 DEHA2G17622p [Debaryomyces hansenii CBS767]